MREPTRTTCPFCLNGCSSGVEFNGVEHKMHYFADAEVNQGRLCPRGNSANIVIDHRERLCRPLLDGHDTTWPEAEVLVRSWLSDVKPEELAIVYSRGRDAEDVRRLHGLAAELNTPNLACGHIEPENGFNYRLEGVADATLSDIESAKTMLLVGDVFNTSPVASWRMLDARYKDRKNRVVVLDSVRTRQAGFAHLFVQVRPGTEPLALLSLAALIDPSVAPGVEVDRFAELAGTTRQQLAAAAAMLGPGLPGFVGSAMHTGRVRYPALHSLAGQLVARAGAKPFTGFRETELPFGPMRFSDLRRRMGEGGIRLLFWTGGLFPFSYSGLLPETAGVEHVVSTSIFRPDPAVRGLVLPMTAELERASVGRSYWSGIERSPLASPLDGTRPFSRVLEWFGRAEGRSGISPRSVGAAEVLEMGVRASGFALPVEEWLLVGEKKAIGLRGFHDPEDEVSVCRTDAARIGVTGRNYLRVRSRTAEGEFRVRITDAVPAGVLMVGTNVHANRALFPLAEDDLTGEATVAPTGVAVEKTERVPVANGENLSVWT
ncbi:hypothetical protein FJY68_10060 [candidate division WOR-3 bacterium]|uniref:4Fe-4S Mo/W bis-MGD-type domain-containing protein n=1 Tax=candidate division WOR-3 bacterium TaxID=2052148 RepID=A0A938BQH3_UNCW3|nr:hypothetical protein [candidate division WOR-3 bacterium]